MNICCQTLTRAQRTQGIECFNLIQQPLFKLQFHPHTIWPKNDFCELPSKTPHDQYHSSDTVHTLFHIVRDLLHPIMILILTIIMILILITTMMIIMMATYFFLIVGDEGWVAPSATSAAILPSHPVMHSDWMFSSSSEPIQNLWQAPGEILRPPEQNLVWKQYSCPPNKRYGYAGHAKGKK